MSISIGGAVSSFNKRNMSAPSLFPQDPRSALSRECLERIARVNNATAASSNTSPSHRVKFAAQAQNDNSNIITINVSGRRYQTYLTTLQRFPSSLLGDPMKRKNFYNQENKEYFFDRNRKAFSGVLHYYQTHGDEIECPTGVSEKTFAQELLFFELFDQKTNDVDSIMSSTEFLVPKNVTLAKIWILFEKPNSSPSARILAVFSISIILLSITVFCLETVPALNPDHQEGKHMSSTWYLLNVVCNAWFTLEFVIRFVAAPNKLDFMKSAVNLIDLISILPFYISELIGHASDNSLAVLRVIRVIRVIRIFKLTRHSRGLHILANTIKASFQELIMLVLFLAIAIILFASAVYFAESAGGHPDNKFRSIPHSFWWAVITMTTVGYGDLTPKTLIGQMVGTLCAISGVLVIALPVPVIVGNFERYYKQERSRHARETEVIRKEKEEETFADMRRSIQMMTHTSIILAGGVKRHCPNGTEQQQNNTPNNDNNNNDRKSNLIYPHSPNKRKTFKERIQDKLAFTFQRPYSDIEQYSDGCVTTPDDEYRHSLVGVVDDSGDMNRLKSNGNVSMRTLPDINIDSPPSSTHPSEYTPGTLESRPSSALGYSEGFSTGNRITKANKGEAIWFGAGGQNEGPNKESSI
ncbi:shaker-related potassium channel tsha2-like isoform X2 [Clytia hemisphaerica]|uniref:BTB domain-containing protein n=2 Tax=Clytia hemisphaerica TaxID=252671 RepID=A0A7M5UVJ6_9CNID